MARVISSYRTNFAKSGAPNGAGLATWPAFGEAGAATMYLGLTSEVGTTPNLREHQLIDVYMDKARHGVSVSKESNREKVLVGFPLRV
jgi:carboxylesterase type B